MANHLFTSPTPSTTLRAGSPLSACRYAQAGTRGDDFLWGLHKKTPKGNPKAEFLFRGLAKDSAS